MGNEVIKLGIVGFGGMGRLHVEQIGFMDDAVIAAVVEPAGVNRSNAEQFFAKKGVAFFDDVSSALSKVQVDGWIVASSTRSHIEVTEQLLSHGCTVLLEKPIAGTLSEAEKIRSLVKPDSSNLMMGHILLWNAEFQTFKSEVNKLGKITAIACSRQRCANHRVRYPDESPFTLIMVHDLYSVHSLVSAQQPCKYSSQQRKHHQGGVDLAQAQMGWSDNTHVSLVANYLIPDDIPGGGNIDELSVSGDSWQARLLYDSGKVQISSKGAVRQIHVDAPIRIGATNYFDDALRNELQHFVLLIKGIASVPLGARYEDACQIQGWIEKFISLTQDKGPT